MLVSLIVRRMKSASFLVNCAINDVAYTAKREADSVFSDDYKKSATRTARPEDLDSRKASITAIPSIMSPSSAGD